MAVLVVPQEEQQADDVASCAELRNILRPVAADIPTRDLWALKMSPQQRAQLSSGTNLAANIADMATEAFQRELLQGVLEAIADKKGYDLVKMKRESSTYKKAKRFYSIGYAGQVKNGGDESLLAQAGGDLERLVRAAEEIHGGIKSPPPSRGQARPVIEVPMDGDHGVPMDEVGKRGLALYKAMKRWGSMRLFVEAVKGFVDFEINELTDVPQLWGVFKELLKLRSTRQLEEGDRGLADASERRGVMNGLLEAWAGLLVWPIIYSGIHPRHFFGDRPRNQHTSWGPLWGWLFETVPVLEARNLATEALAAEAGAAHGGAQLQQTGKNDEELVEDLADKLKKALDI